MRCARIQLLRVNDRVLAQAGRMEPPELRSLGAIHLASARALGSAVRQIVTYDERMANAAKALGWSVASPTSRRTLRAGGVRPPL